MSTNTDDIISGGLFAPIEPLKLNDTIYTWYNTTNEIIDALNPLAVYDVASGPGIIVSKISGGIAVVSVNTGCGLKFDSNISLCLDIDGVPETTEANTEDYYVLERYGGTNVTTDSADCETLFKIQATNMLPYIVSGDHDFIGGAESLFKVSSNNFSIDSNKVEFKTTDIYLNNNPQTTDDDFEYRVNIPFSGFIVNAFDEDPTFGFVGNLLAWKSNQNFSVTSDRSYVSDSAGENAVFNFSTKTASQEDVFLKLLTGVRTSDDDVGGVFGIHANDSINKLSFTYENQLDTNGQVDMFTSRYDSGAEQTEFSIEGKIFIRDIEDSSQFLTTSTYSQYIVPLTNTNGILDFRYTNRFVSENYDPTLSVGDVVRFVYTDNTNTTEDIYITGAQADSETNSKVVGVVVDISGGKVTVALSGICEYTGATSGQIYYLSQGTAGAVTPTKPTTGIVKEVFVGIDDSSVLVFASSTLQTPNFGSVLVDGGDTVDAVTYGDTLSLVAGSNISLSKNTANEIVITSGSLIDADYWKTIVTDSGSIVATISEDTLTVTGSNGITTDVDSNNGLVITAPNSYSTIEIVGENTDELDYTLTASIGNDTLTIRSGIGINITSSTNNDIVIEATGLSVPANRSITNQKLAEMPSYSIKAAQANGEPTDIYQSEEVFEITFPVLADYYDVYTITDSNGDTYPVFQDPITLIEYPTIYSTVLGQRLSTGTPDAVAGYVYGRVVDEAGNVSEIKPLNRRELRLLLGAAQTGFIEENNKVFNSWQIWSTPVNGEGAGYAQLKSGIINFLAGTGIQLTSGTLGNGESAIEIIATGDTARFGTIINDTTSESLDATVIGSTLHVVERDAIGIDVNSNNGLDFYIKNGSVTNDMLDPMSENTVKVRTAGTNSTGPEDLLIGEAQILGRPTGGELKSLTATEVRTIIGLTSSDYFKAIECYTGATNIGTVNASTTETLTLRGGTNITLAILGDNSIQINALTDDTTGVKTIAFTETGSIYTPTHILFDELEVSGSGGLYTNIDILPIASSGGNLSIQFDMGVMPQRSVKVASATYNGIRGGYLASNLIVQPGNVLGVLSGGTAVTSIPFSTVVANSGLNYYSSIGVGASTLSASGASKLNFVSGGGITLTGSGSTITISSSSILQTDPNPTLGADLNVNGKFLLGDGLKNLYLSGNITTSSNHYLNIYKDTSKMELRVLRETAIASAVDIVLTPYGTGTVISKTFSSSSTNNLTIKTGTTDGRIYVDGGNANYTIISPTSAKSLYLSPGTSSSDINMYFYDGSTSKSLIARRSTDDTALIHSNASGNLILVAGYTGSGVSTGSNSIRMNSDVLFDSSKSITSVDNIVKINTTDSGYLKLSGNSKSNTQRVYSNNFDSVITRVIDTYTLSSIGKSVKYLIRGENVSDSTDSFVIEFNVIVSGTEVVQDVVSKIYTSGSPSTTQNIVPSIVSNGTTVTVSLNTISGSYSLTVYRTSLT